MVQLTPRRYTMMNAFSLFQDEKLMNVLIQVLNNKRTKKDLEKTEWWNFLICESLINENLQTFIKCIWPTIEQKYILHELLDCCECDKFKIHPNVENLLIDKKLIEIIKKEQNIIKNKQHRKIKLEGPTPTPMSIYGTKRQIKCVAVLEKYTQNIAYESIYQFLIDLSQNWLDKLEKGSRHIDCDNQLNEDKNDEIAEIIFSNFPKTFDRCEQTQEFYLYICNYNWNFTKKA